MINSAKRRADNDPGYGGSGGARYGLPAGLDLEARPDQELGSVSDTRLARLGSGRGRSNQLWSDRRWSALRAAAAGDQV